MVDLKTSDFWLKCVPFVNSDSGIGFIEEGFQRYKIDGLTVRSMLSSFELSLLYALARDYWSGEGEIVDTGCLYGLTTRCLAEGTVQNDSVMEEAKSQRIFAYDLFLMEDYDFYSSDSSTVHTGSLLPDFIRLNHNYLDHIVPCAGDFEQMRWGKRPIEILMIDAAKSWELNNAHVNRFFPCLIPGKSVIIQQDYMNWHEYWVQIAMEYFADKFELQQVLYGSSALFLCTSPITEQEAEIDLRSLPTDQKRELMNRARAKAPREAEPALMCGLTSMLIDEGCYGEAREMIERVCSKQITDNPVLDFHGIVHTNKQRVIDKLSSCLLNASC